MTFWHRHVYKENQRIFSGRIVFQGSNVHMSPLSFQRITCGTTTILSMCDCGKMQKIEVLGDARQDAAVEELNRMYQGSEPR